MYSFIRGKIAHKTPTQVILMVGGIGYEINISLKTYSFLEGKEEVQLWIHLSVREDDMSLYGFATRDERKLFRKLISVSGIGTNTARLVLSGLRVDEIVEGVLYEDVSLFQQVKGIGKKTAQRLILDLKDKLGEIGQDNQIKSSKSRDKNNTAYEEALSGLMTLGYKKPQVVKALKSVRNEDEGSLDSGEVIKLVLKILS